MPDDMKAVVERLTAHTDGALIASIYGGRTLEVFEAYQADLRALLAERRKMVGALEQIYALADSFRPILEGICPPGCLPTRGMEEKASILARPFAIARAALTGSETNA